MLNPSGNSPEQQHQSQPLKQLIYKHPIVLGTGLWMTLIVVGYFATLGLLSPGPIEQETPKPTPAPAAVQVSTAKEDLPLSLFSAIAIGCAAGSFLFVYVLKNSARSHQSSRRLSTASTDSKKRRRPSKRRRVSRATQPVASPVVASIEVRPPIPDEKLSQVTVLSPEESHPLDRGNDSLADLLDLRKHQSLASLMRGK